MKTIAQDTHKKLRSNQQLYSNACQKTRREKHIYLISYSLKQIAKGNVGNKTIFKSGQKSLPLK